MFVCGVQRGQRCWGPGAGGTGGHESLDVDPLKGQCIDALDC